MTAPAHSPYIPQIRLYQDWLREQRGLRFADYDELWRWSTTDLPAFWQSIWDYFQMQSPTPHRAVLEGGPMPDCRWFPGAHTNYARQVLRHAGPAHAAGQPAILSEDERGRVRSLSWPELRRQIASLALALKDMGVQRGDRVAAYLPNVPETAVAFLACASIGAVWSVCAPDMGTAAVLDRFKQIEPKVLIAADGVHYGGKPLDRSHTVAELRAALPSLGHVITLRTPYAAERVAGAADFEALTDRDNAATAAFEPDWLPFDHPLWVVYSSGTTGLPKPIVHGHGGILMTMLAAKILHNDIGPSYAPNSFGERFHWYSSTGWVMWNAQVAGLAGGTTIVLYDGNPGGSKDHPDWHVLWRFAARHRVTFFGAGAAYYANCMKAGVDLPALQAEGFDLRRIRALGVTGSPLAEDVQRWGSAQFDALGTTAVSPAGPSQGAKAPSGGSEPRERGGPIWWCNISGGTDFCGAFIGGHRELPQVPGQMQCRQLGCAVEAWSEDGRPLIGEVGELVCTQPIPSMPLYFWNDEGKQRYLSSYFDMYPGVWRHGDWLKIGADGGCVIFGRSDATINRHGLRMGTSEIYAAVEALPEVMDSLVVDLEYLGRDSYMPLFVVLRPGVDWSDALRERIAGAIRSALSPRFVPDEIVPVAEIPRTLSGKKQELPIKKLLLGQPLDKVVNRDAMANPGCLGWYVAFAQQHLAHAAAHPAAHPTA
ncbi:acetoacetate--CoA ligase [Macromonas nakdongensis]|uniref:acetoacetate--CoA ligase n=1 Tax=Macromonas nakdongensis TaxID=1843082 RepID=UPI000C33800C|nr:acetoacetate--CoA ligase [Macromonas nakdongensis]